MTRTPVEGGDAESVATVAISMNNSIPTRTGWFSCFRMRKKVSPEWISDLVTSVRLSIVDEMLDPLSSRHFRSEIKKCKRIILNLLNQHHLDREKLTSQRLPAAVSVKIMQTVSSTLPHFFQNSNQRSVRIGIVPPHLRSESTKPSPTLLSDHLIRDMEEADPWMKHLILYYLDVVNGKKSSIINSMRSSKRISGVRTSIGPGLGPGSGLFG